ncbi:MAG: fasciclin domain-containing protein [Trueperaceae bacterium]|nr:fasciclin domain-containing protein [Trueperaceae bacterium]
MNRIIDRLAVALSVSLLVLSSAVFAQGPTVVDVAAQNDDLSTFVTALQATEDLLAELEAFGPYTIFAPSNEAFAALSEADLQAILENQAALESLLRYHVVPGDLDAEEVAGADELEAFTGQAIDVTTENGLVYVEGAQVLTANITAANGTIHIIDAIMLPAPLSELMGQAGEGVSRPLESAETIIDVVSTSQSFTTLLEAIETAGLFDTLDTEGPFTVFAPTNDAFSDLSPEALADLLGNPDALANVLQYHVVAGELAADDLVTLTAVETLTGDQLSVEVSDGTVTVGGATVIDSDIEADNGLIHAINAVLLSPADDAEMDTEMDTDTAAATAASETIVDIVVGDERFSTLEQAVVAADLTDALASEGPLTVFAPTNDAFAALPDGLLEDLLENPEALAAVLSYHVVAGRLTSGELISTRSVDTLSGESLEIAVAQGTVVVGGNAAEVTTPDVMSTNGVIHIIDAVLLPPSAQ